MNPSFEFEPSPLDLILQAFREAWENGEQPQIEIFLAENESEQCTRDVLVQALIPVDIEFRVMAGEAIDSKTYEPLGECARQIAADYFSIDDTPGPSDVTWDSEAENFSASSTETDAEKSLQKKVLAGKYKLIQEIGSGGMGTVWLAQQENPVRRQVAVKVIRTAIGSREARIRFEAERQALAMMNHPNIAQVHDAGTMDDGSPYLVMELVRGQPLTQYCNENRLSIRNRLELLIPVCHAVQHAHQKGIIHRDIKPSNILVSLQGDVPVPKVIDFGLAKAQENQTRLTEESMMTEFGRVLGTLQYMSPEQAGTSNLDVDARSDIFSLGVVLYQLLTSTTPLDRETIAQNSLIQIIDKICRSDLTRPSIRLAEKKSEDLALMAAQRQTDPRKLIQLLKGELDWIALKALERDRTHRYQTAKDLADEIQRFLDNETVSARPPSNAYLLKKFVRKHRRLVVSTLLAAGLLVAGTITSTYFFLQASKLQKRASRQLSVYREMFASTNPMSGAGKNLSPSDILEKAEADVMETFSDDPVGQAELLHEIGKSYQGQGYFENAVSTLENAFRIQKQQLGSIHADTLKTQESLAIAYFKVDRERMLELMQGVYDGRKKLLPDDCDEMMNTRHRLATAAFVKYKEDKKENVVHPELIQQAIQIFEENYELQQKRFGPEHEETLKTQTNLANAYLKNDQVKTSMKHGRKALKGWQKKIESAPDDSIRNKAISNFLTTQNNFAEALEKDGQLQKAIDAYLKTLRQKEDRYDIGHDTWRVTLRLVMTAMKTAGQSEQALSLFDESYQKVSSSDRVFKKEVVLADMRNIKDKIFGAGAETSAKDD